MTRGLFANEVKVSLLFCLSDCDRIQAETLYTKWFAEKKEESVNFVTDTASVDISFSFSAILTESLWNDGSITRLD